MKTKLAVIAIGSVALATLAGDVRFNLRDFITTSGQLARRTAEVQPQSSPRAEGTNVILSEVRYFNTGSHAEFTATNMTEGTYRVLVYGPTRTNVFRVQVPTFSGTTNASAILISSANNGLETEDGRSIDLE